MGVEKRKIRRRQTREYPEPIGRITIECVDLAITGLWFEGQAHYGAGRRDFIEEDAPAIQAGFEWLDRYFAGKRPGPDELKLDPKGTDFQLKVWSELCCLDYGETTTYGEIANNIDLPGGGRAVGSAVGCNPISIIIPCHRVLGAKGSLTGYAGGEERKRWLLEHESK